MRTRSLIQAVSLFLFVCTGARADYQPLALTELFGGSDLVVLGTIESVSDGSFTLRDTDVYAGKPGAGPLQVQKYSDWPGGRRWNDYRAGQTVLLFLAAAADEKAEGAPWQIRGLGGEGEMPIEDAAVFPHGLNLEGFPRQEFEVQSGEIYGYRFELDTFTSALTGYLRCFGSQRHAAAERIGKDPSTPACTDSEIADFRAVSPLHAYLVTSTAGGTD